MKAVVAHWRQKPLDLRRAEVAARTLLAARGRKGAEVAG